MGNGCDTCEDPPDRSGWLCFGAFGALSFSWLPIVAIPAALGVLISGIRVNEEQPRTQ